MCAWRRCGAPGTGCGSADVRPLSLRLRLTLLWGAVSLAVLLGLELLTLAVLSAQLSRATDRDLGVAAAQCQGALAGAASVADIDMRAESFPGSDPARAPLAAIYVLRLDDGSVVTNTSDAGLRATISGAQPPPRQAVTVHDRVHGDLRVAAVPIDQGGHQVGELRVGLSLSGVEATVGDLLTPLLVADAVLIGLGGLVAYLAVGGGLAPVRQITATAAGISEGDLSGRIAYRGPRDEVGRPAETFDAMLARLESGFEQRQAFYSLASHELRTPLTIVRGHLEVLRRTDRPSREEVSETLDIALEELSRVTDEVNDMLLLGRMLLGQPGELEEIDAGSVVRDVHRRARGLAVRDWQLDVGGPVLVRANREQLSRALLNLVTNAVRHTGEGDRVRLACLGHGRRANLEVADGGAGIPAAELPHVFAPWYRGARDGSVGGLGLMIVREVARAHGGDVDVDSREGAGSTFTIRLPTAGAAASATPDRPRRHLRP
jgi:signal transduction histidine kinase